MSATLLDATPEIPTALVVASGDAFNVVPLTTDRAFLDRYLNVIAPDVMPLEGRALQVTVAQAEGILTLAGVLAGQGGSSSCRAGALRIHASAASKSPALTSASSRPALPSS